MERVPEEPIPDINDFLQLAGFETELVADKHKNDAEESLLEERIRIVEEMKDRCWRNIRRARDIPEFARVHKPNETQTESSSTTHQV